jgi:hypothetical protein
MRERPGEHFVIAAFPVYLLAVEADVYAGSAASPVQLMIVPSKSHRGPSSTADPVYRQGHDENDLNQHDRVKPRNARRGSPTLFHERPSCQIPNMLVMHMG